MTLNLIDIINILRILKSPNMNLITYSNLVDDIIKCNNNSKTNFINYICNVIIECFYSVIVIENVYYIRFVIIYML